MKSFFKELFEYSHYFNQKLWGVFTDNTDKTSEKSIQLFSHILNAHRVWNNRIEPRQTPFGIWEVHPVQHCKDIDNINYEHSLGILEKFDLNDTVNYTTTSGQQFTNSVRDILFQVINHSTYHRGQIATEFRKNGLDPILTDYIFFKR